MASVSVIMAVLIPIAFSIAAWHSSFFYDDAYMFYRYAYNLRHFHAIIWNQNGPHTYGTTSLPWMLVVTVFSYLPLSPVIVLPMASSLCFIAALVLLAYGFSKNACSAKLQDFWLVFFLLTLSLATSTTFLYAVTNGMETMLSFLANAVLCLLTWKIIKSNPDNKIIFLLSGAAFAAYLIRPESGICDLLTPALAMFLLQRTGSVPKILTFWLTTSALILAQLWACHMYFGSALPLSFYIKSTGMMKAANSFTPAWTMFFYAFFGIAAIFLSLIALAGRRIHLKLLAVYLLPTFLTVLYLARVVQISGDYGRYYVPFLPYVVLPAFLILDEYIFNGFPITPKEFLPRFAMVAIFIALASESYGEQIWKRAGYISTVHPVSTQADSYVEKDSDLPVMTWKQSIQAISNDVACKLPSGVRMAAGEVGYLSGMCRTIWISDLSGLNDRHIAQQGFSSKYMLDQRPDLIWLPIQGYTVWRSEILSDPRFQQQYSYISGAFNFGIAIRKDSRYYAQILSVLRAAWPKYYPNTCVAPICEGQPIASLR